MKTKVKYLFSVALAALTAASCTDTWDEHYGTEGSEGASTAATETLWDIIKSDKNLSKFAELAEDAVYYRNETKAQNDYTYKDLLSGSQVVTAFIPTNDAYTETQWDSLQKLKKEYPYTLHQQLLSNTITLWRQTTVGSDKADIVTMINGKKNVFDKAAYTIGGSAIVEHDRYAKNGVLHTIKSPVPFFYSLYEYLKDGANAKNNNIVRFHDLLVSNDSTIFDEDNSIEGYPDADGNPTYMDSVENIINYMLMYKWAEYPRNNFNSTITENILMHDECFGAPIRTEDSTYLMIIPTDEAYREAHDRLKGYYKYAKAYVDTEKGDLNNAGLVRKVEDPEALTEKSLQMDIYSPVVFNVNLQPNAYGRIGTWTLNDFLQNSGQAKYFTNTYGDTLRSDETWQKEDLFRGKRISMSNGCALVADTWNFPSKFYKPDINIELQEGVMYNRTSFTTRNTVTNQSLSNEQNKEWIDSTGRISQDNYLSFRPNTPSNLLNIEFKLVGTNWRDKEEVAEREVMSGTYDIYVVCVPAYYANSTEGLKLPENGIYAKTKLAATINYNDGSIDPNTPGTIKNATFDTDTKTPIIYNGEKVDTILLFKDFTFPYSYKNMIHCYPTLTIKTLRASTAEQNQGYTHAINLDRIILKSKD